MPDLRFHGTRPQHTEIPRPKRGEGQWALGFNEPLNKNGALELLSRLAC